MTRRKKIKILSSGIIRIKGYIHGPVLTPYHEDLDVIYKMVSEGIKVVEVADDGKEFPITIANIGDDNSSAARKAAAEKKAPVAPAKAPEKKPEPVKTEVKPEPKVEVKPEEPKQEHRKPDEVNKYQKYNNNNKYQKNRYNAPEVKVEEPAKTEEVVVEATDATPVETTEE